MQYQVSFSQAIQMGFNNYVNFNGRSSRSEYWWWCLFTFIIGAVLGAINGWVNIQWLIGLVNLALLLPGLGLSVRRLHDINKSGWWIFIALIPLVGAILLIYWFVQPSNPGDNQYGPEPNVVY